MSIFVEYDQWGRMGNRMFQYALGYILSQEKNTMLYADSIPNFNITSTKNNTVPINPIYTRAYGDNNIDYNALLNTDRDIVVNSYVQKARYYTPHRDTLRSVFGIKNQPCINSDKLVLHIRETDYTQINCFLGYEYYRKLIDRTMHRDVIIVTDNSDCETVKRLLLDGCTLNTKGYVDKFNHVSDNRAMIDFTTLLKSDNIALSQSSFSWWAAFLGYHKNIYFPNDVNGIWKINPDVDDIDLYFINEN